MSPAAYHVCREKGTEPPYSGAYNDNKKEGTYLCACCKAELFSSKSKYDSGSGWPSFWEAAKGEMIEEKSDKSLFSERTEILCSQCGSHLGHVFPDGPQPTGLRYCVNSLSLTFAEEKS